VGSVIPMRRVRRVSLFLLSNNLASIPRPPFGQESIMKSLGQPFAGKVIELLGKLLLGQCTSSMW